jgi:hypothetical protein
MSAAILLLAAVEGFLAFVAGANAGSHGRTATGLRFLALAGFLSGSSAFHIVLCLSLWRLRAWARSAALGMTLLYGLGTLAVPPIASRLDRGLDRVWVSTAAWAGAVSSVVLAALFMSPKTRLLFSPGCAAAVAAPCAGRCSCGQVVSSVLTALCLAAAGLTLAVTSFVIYSEILMIMVS